MTLNSVAAIEIWVPFILTLTTLGKREKLFKVASNFPSEFCRPFENFYFSLFESVGEK